MIKYKINILAVLKEKGYNQTRLQKENLLSKQTIQNILDKKNISMDTLNKICIMTKLQPKDIIEVIPTEEEIIKYY